MLKQNPVKKRITLQELIPTQHREKKNFNGNRKCRGFRKTTSNYITVINGPKKIMLYKVSCYSNRE